MTDMTFSELVPILRERCSCPTCREVLIMLQEPVEAEPDSGRPVFLVPQVQR